MSILSSLSSDVHPERAPAEVEEAVGFVGEELGGDLEEAAARIDDDAGFAQNSELLGDDVGVPTGVLRQLGDHERTPISELVENVPAAGAADDTEHGFTLARADSQSRLIDNHSADCFDKTLAHYR